MENWTCLFLSSAINIQGVIYSLLNMVWEVLCSIIGYHSIGVNIWEETQKTLTGSQGSLSFVHIEMTPDV